VRPRPRDNSSSCGMRVAHAARLSIAQWGCAGESSADQAGGPRVAPYGSRDPALRSCGPAWLAHGKPALVDRQNPGFWRHGPVCRRPGSGGLEKIAVPYGGARGFESFYSSGESRSELLPVDRSRGTRCDFRKKSPCEQSNIAAKGGGKRLRSRAVDAQGAAVGHCGIPRAPFDRLRRGNLGGDEGAVRTSARGDRGTRWGGRPRWSIAAGPIATMTSVAVEGVD